MTKQLYKITYVLFYGNTPSFETTYTHAYSAKQAAAQLQHRLGKSFYRTRDIKVMPVPQQTKQLVDVQLSFV